MLDYATIAGLIVGFLAVGVAASSGGGIKGFLDPMSAILVIGGAFSALLVNFPFPLILQALRDARQIFRQTSVEPTALAAVIVNMAAVSRRQGLLALENELIELPQSFLRRSVEKVVDGVTPEVLRETLEAELEVQQQQSEEARQVFEALGAYSPAFGMIGTIVGLVKMAATLDDPSSLGPALALALITTFYGALMANLVWLPVAGKLKAHADRDFIVGNMIIKGVVAISSGANPRSVEEIMEIYTRRNKSAAAEPLSAEGEAVEVGA